MEGGSSSFGNPGGWGGGSKNRAFRRGGVDFFWNNPLLDWGAYAWRGLFSEFYGIKPLV